MANTMNCVIIYKKEDELYNISIGIIIAQRNVEAMKRPVPIYDFTAFGKAIKEARTKRGESRKNVSDDMDISPRYLANIENKGQQPSLQIFYELVTRYDIKNKSEMVVHGTDGRIREKNSYGNDPYPPKG